MGASQGISEDVVELFVDRQGCSELGTAKWIFTISNEIDYEELATNQEEIENILGEQQKHYEIKEKPHGSTKAVVSPMNEES